MAIRVRERRACTDKTIDCRSTNKSVSECSNRVEALLIGAIPENVRTHEPVARMEAEQWNCCRILSDSSSSRNSGNGAPFAIGLAWLGQITQPISPSIDAIERILGCPNEFIPFFKYGRVGRHTQVAWSSATGSPSSYEAAQSNLALSLSTMVTLIKRSGIERVHCGLSNLFCWSSRRQ